MAFIWKSYVLILLLFCNVFWHFPFWSVNLPIWHFRINYPLKRSAKALPLGQIDSLLKYWYIIEGKCEFWIGNSFFFLEGKCFGIPDGVQLIFFYFIVFSEQNWGSTNFSQVIHIILSGRWPLTCNQMDAWMVTGCNKNILQMVLISSTVLFV